MYMPSPLPRHSDRGYYLARSPSHVSLPRKCDRVGLCNDLFEACSAFTHVTACTLAGSSKMTRYIRGSSHFVTSMTAPIASGWSDSRVGLSPTGKTPPLHGARQNKRYRCTCSWRARYKSKNCPLHLDSRKTHRLFGFCLFTGGKAGICVSARPSRLNQPCTCDNPGSVYGTPLSP